jgi:tetratricopeptide (TPR) repeat protein
MVTTKNRLWNHVRCLFAAMALAWLCGCTPAGPRALLEGKRLLDDGKYADAVEELKLATQLMATNATAWNYLGLAYHHAGDAAHGVDAYQRALNLNSDLLVAHYNLGCLLLEQNTPESLDHARNELTAFTVRQTGSLDGWRKLGTAQLRLGDLAGADASFRQALKISPGDIESLNDFGLVQLHRRHYRDAATYFNAILKVQPTYGPAILNLAVADTDLGSRSAALEKYRGYLALVPKQPNWDSVNDLAQQLDAELNPPPRPVVTNTTVAVNPVTNAPPTNDLAASPKLTTQQLRTTPQPGPRPDVVAVPDEPVAKVAGSNLTESRPPAMTNTVGIAPATNAVQSSAKNEKKGLLARLNPMTLFHHDAAKAPNAPRSSPTAPTGTMEVPAETHPHASQPVREIPAARYPYLPPGQPASGDRAGAELLVSRGAMARHDTKLNDAVALFKQAAQTDPSCFEAQSSLGLAAYDVGDLSTALRADEQALAIQPDSFATRYNFAIALKKANYVVDSAQQLEQLLAAYSTGETQQHLAMVHLALGNLYSQQLHQNARAREHYLKVLELDPQNSEATSVRYWLRDNSR